MVLFCKPRVCGEKLFACFFLRGQLGSPPRMRGKVCGGGVVAVVEGITPAYAGKRRSSPGRASGRGDHPRMCGEKMMKAGSNCAMLGSPPRMRGKVFDCFGPESAVGITPAYAGKSSISCHWRSDRRDHPRVCGEKKAKNRTATTNAGSPPRMRGKAAHGRHGVRCGGITPAYAGKRYPRLLP